MDDTNHSLRIFIVDDDLIYLNDLDKLLSKNKNYRVSTFTSGEACLDQISLCPDVIILDYHFYNQYRDPLNGLDILRSIKDTYQEIAVIMCSSQKDGFIVHKLAEEGAYMYILKDKKFYGQLVSLVNELASEKQTNHETVNPFTYEKD